MLRLMSSNTPAAPAPPAEDVVEHPRGLIPPTRRGRSQRLIGEVIGEMGLARRETFAEAVAISREQGRTTGQTLIECGALRHDQLARALAERLGVDYIDLSAFEIDLGAVNLVAAEVAERYQAVPVGFLADHTLLLAMADPTNVVTIDEISMITGMKVIAAAAAQERLGPSRPRAAGHTGGRARALRGCCQQALRRRAGHRPHRRG
jgi:type IV pilus assembly protein PilB